MGDAAALNHIERQWEAGQRDVAGPALADYLTKYPEDHVAWSLRGLMLLDSQPVDLEAALIALDRSIALSPTYPAAYNAGNALLDLGRLSEAIERFELSISCFDRYPQAWVNKGIALHRLSRTNEALPLFEHALKLEVDFLPALRCKAVALEKLGDKEASEAIYARMVELHPGDVGILSEYGRALSRLPQDNCMELHPHGREWKAVETLNAVLERRPDDLAAWLAKAEVLCRSLHANVCFRTSAMQYVPGPLRTGSFAGDLRALVADAQERFGDHPSFERYRAVFDEAGQIRDET